MKAIKTNEIIHTNDLLNHPELDQLVKYAQIIPIEMLSAVKTEADAHGISLELEMASRLLATFVAPETLTVFEQIMQSEFSHAQALAECKRKRYASAYVYELAKLELFLQFQGQLPRDFKEAFILIDVKQETKRILAEIQNQKKSETE